MYTQDTNTKDSTLQPSTYLQKDSTPSLSTQNQADRSNTGKQVQQTTEPVLPHIKWNTDSIELMVRHTNYLLQRNTC